MTMTPMKRILLMGALLNNMADSLPPSPRIHEPSSRPTQASMNKRAKAKAARKQRHRK